MWLAGLLGLSLLRGRPVQGLVLQLAAIAVLALSQLRGRPVQGLAVQLGAIAALALAWWAARGLLRQGRLVPAGYLLSTVLLLYVAAGTLLLPQYALHLGMAYLLSVLAAAAIVGRTAGFLFAALSVLLHLLILQFAPALRPATAAILAAAGATVPIAAALLVVPAGAPVAITIAIAIVRTSVFPDLARLVLRCRRNRRGG